MIEWVFLKLGDPHGCRLLISGLLLTRAHVAFGLKGIGE